MNKLFISMLLSSTLAFAQSVNPGSCPFSNSAFKDLRSSADALRKKIDLPAKCQEVSNRINSAGEDVNKLVNDIIALKEKNDPEDKKKQQDIAVAIINSLKGLSTTYANAANQIKMTNVGKLY